MRVTLTGAGMEAIQADLAGFSDRRLAAAGATALTRTAKAMAVAWQGQIGQRIDRPNPRTQSATTFLGASAGRLEAAVLVKDRVAGTPPAEYLTAQEQGGRRLVKKFERSLIASGAMPAGYVTVPGRHATLDGYGNPGRSLIIAVISQLGRDFSPGYQRVISKNTDKRLARQRKLGRQFVAVLPADARKQHLNPGIYERMPDGSRKAIFVYRRAVSYRKRLDLINEADKAAPEILRAELLRAIDESTGRLAARGKS